MTSNQITSLDAAMTLLFHIGPHFRGTSEAGCSPEFDGWNLEFP